MLHEVFWLTKQAIILLLSVLVTPFQLIAKFLESRCAKNWTAI